MQGVNSYLSQETLGDLEFLEKRAEKLVNDQSVADGRLANIHTMQQQINNLRHRKQQLLNELKAEKSGPDALISDLQQEGRKDMSRDMRRLLLRREQLEEVKAAYRLMGRTITVVDETTVRLCVDTCFEGVFSPPHYVDLKLEQAGPVITKHTLPPFINMDSAKLVLQTGIPEFFNYLQMYLQAFQARKSFIVKVQEDFEDYLSDDIEATPTVDWVRLTLKAVPLCGGRSVTVQLKYTDTTTWTPRRVKVTVHDLEAEEEGGEEEKEPKDFSYQNAMISEVLLNTSLPEAIAAILMPHDDDLTLTKQESESSSSAPST